MISFRENAMRTIGASAVIAVVLAAAPAQAADGPAILKQQCSACHAIEKPQAATTQRLWERKGPDLYYAGLKFNREWLVKWLQSPTRIRPAGAFYTNNIKTGDTADVVDDTRLKPHPVLAAADATAAADALLALKGPEGLASADTYSGEKPNMRMGEMFFSKLRGCSACHMSAPDNGGRSGPELYTAAQRLQPNYIVQYIKDPQKFDPHVWMPRQELSDKDVQRLTGYLMQLSDGEKK